MKLKLFGTALVAALAVMAFGGSASLAAHENPGKPAAAKHQRRGVAFIFRGQLLAAPTATSTSISVRVMGGNRPALRKLLGAGVDQTFAVGANTVFLRWANGVPTVVQKTNLVAGDYVTVRIRAPRRATLAEILAQPAAVVAARSARASRPANPLFLFRGTLTAAPTATTLSVRVQGGNKRALKRLLGQSVDRTFTYNANTIFLRWQGRVPTVISPSQLTVGAKIVVRIRAPRGSTLAQIEATPATRVAQHVRPSH